MDWWDVLKAPLYDRVDRDAALLQYLRDATGEDQEPTRMRQINMGEEVPLTLPKNVADKRIAGNEHGFGFRRLDEPGHKGSPLNPENKKYTGTKNDNFTHFFQSSEGNVRAGIKHLGKNHYGIDHFGTRDDVREAGLGREGLNQLRRELEEMHGGEVFMTPINTIVPESRGFWEKMAREGVTNPYGYIFPNQPPIPGPNDANYVKKEAKSPKALAHKRKYETEYESTPARKKYRRELERERRKRGVAGKGGGDMSHTKTGKIVVEDPHTNRARSHPSVGSTLKMVRIVKSYYSKEPESHDEDGNPMQTTRTGKTVPLARARASPVRPPEINIAHPKNIDAAKRGADAFVEEVVAPTITHEETHRAMDPDIRAARNELPDTMSEKEKRDWYMRAHEIGAYQGQFPGGQDAHEEAEATALGQRDSPRHPFIDESVTRFPKPIVKMVIVKEEQKKLFVEGQKTLDGQPAFAPTDFVAEQQRRAKAQADEEAKIARKRAMVLQAKRAGMTTPLHEFQQNPE